MTVSSEISRWEYTGNGVLDTYQYTAKIYIKTDLVVYVDGMLKDVDVDYSVTNVGIDGGGNVVFTAPPPNLSSIVIYIDLPLTQLTNLIDGDKLPAEALEATLDRAVKIVQRLSGKFDKAIRLPDYSLSNGALSSDLIANYFLKVNPTATAFELEAVVPAGTDLTPYAKLDGRAGGQTIEGGTEASEDLILESTHHATKGFTIIRNGLVFDVRDYASINAAITAIGATPATLVLSNAQTLTANLIIPSTLSLVILKGGSIIKASTYSLTINGPLGAGLYQIFSGFSAGNVTFGIGSIKAARPEWWLTNTVPGTTDMVTAIQCAVDSFDLICLGRTEYATSAAIVLGTNKKLLGTGRKTSLLKPLNDSQTMISLSYGGLTRAYVEVSEVGFDGGDKTGTVGISTVLAGALKFNNLFFAGLEININIDRGQSFDIRDILVEGATNKAGRSQFLDSTGVSYVQHIDIRGYHIRNLGNGVQTPALLFRRATNLVLSDFQANDLDTGGVCNGILIDNDCQGLKIGDSHIVKPNIGIQLASNGGNSPTFTEFHNVDIDQPQTAGYSFDAGNYHSVIGGSITGGGQAIIIGTTYVSVSETQIDGFGANGIVVNPGIGGFKIMGNRVSHVTGAAIVVSAGASDYYMICDNDVSVANGSGVADGGTGVHKVVTDNLTA